MPDSFYPSIDLPFIEGLILASGKVIPQSKIKVGDTTAFVCNGQQAMHKRLILIRELEPGQITFEMATSLAIRIGFMRQLLLWLEQNKNWKDGGYNNG